MPSKFVLLFLLLLAGTQPGCAALRGVSPEGRGNPEELFDALFPPGAGSAALRGEAEVTLSMAGRRVSLPGALLLASPDRFRIDLLDPLDRPLAVIFSDGPRLVQYQPAMSAAAFIIPVPPDCTDVAPGAWVAALLGDGERAAAKGRWQLQSGWGGTRLVRYEAASLRQEAGFDEGITPPALRSLSWYCGGRPVMRLQIPSFIGKGQDRLPEGFDISYPASGLVVSVRFRQVESAEAPEERLLTPSLPGRTSWTTWDLVPGE